MTFNKEKNIHRSETIKKNNYTNSNQCVYDLESEWPAHNQGKTLGWKAREKTQYKNY